MPTVPDTPETRKMLDRFRAEGRLTEGRPAVLDSNPPAPASDVSEKDFMAAVIAYAKGNGWLIYHTYLSRRSAAGYPDITAVKCGVLVFAELKVGTNQPTANQKTWLEELDKCSSSCVETYLWRPSDWPEIVKVLS